MELTNGIFYQRVFVFSCKVVRMEDILRHVSSFVKSIKLVFMHFLLTSAFVPTSNKSDSGGKSRQLKWASADAMRLRNLFETRDKLFCLQAQALDIQRNFEFSRALEMGFGQWFLHLYSFIMKLECMEMKLTTEIGIYFNFMTQIHVQEVDFYRVLENFFILEHLNLDDAIIEFYDGPMCEH